MADKPVIAEKDVEWNEFFTGEKFGSRYRRLGVAAGAKGLMCSVYEVPRGRRAFPMHAHFGIEEAIYVLSGSGTLRIGAEEYPVEAGSYAAFPPGPDHAHQLINTGDQVLRYLCLSDSADPDVVRYPDSGKLAAFAGHSVKMPPAVRSICKEDCSVGYFDGEDIG
jgi:uncharacterized cupin superfamily protein